MPVEAISGNVATQIRVCEQTIHQIRHIGRKKEGGVGNSLKPPMSQNSRAASLMDCFDLGLRDSVTSGSFSPGEF